MNENFGDVQLTVLVENDKFWRWTTRVSEVHCESWAMCS